MNAMKKRLSSTLLAALLLFLLNWFVWAYCVIVLQKWELTPISFLLKTIAKSGDLNLVRLTSVLITVFMIIISIRIYLYLLLLEHDDDLHRVIFTDNPRWVLVLELFIRCLAVVAVNFIYYSSNERIGDFKMSLVITTSLVCIWNLLMVRRLSRVTHLNTVFQRDIFVLLCALFYLFFDYKHQNSIYSIIPFCATIFITGGIFWVEMTSFYWVVIKRLCGRISLSVQ